MKTVSAIATAADIDEWKCFVVSFAGAREDPPWSLDVAIALEWDEQDAALGQDTYSVTVNGGATIYGGVLRCSTEQHKVSIEFRPEAARELGIPRRLSFSLQGSEQELLAVHQGLSRVFSPDLRSAPHLDIEGKQAPF